MKIDCIADLHGNYPDLEGGDLLIVAGDLTARHTDGEFLEFCEWLDNQRYTEVIVIAGNHDTMLFKKDTETIVDTLKPYKYLCDSGTEIQWSEPTLTKDGLEHAPSNYSFANKKLKIWGSPWTPQFPNMNPHCMAFTRPYMQSLKDRWDLIPDDTDILITHGPPNGILDKVKRDYNASVGDMDLLRAVKDRIRPKLHVFGHIHEGYGQFILKHWPLEEYVPDTRFVNCSIMDENYEPVNAPIRIIL